MARRRGAFAGEHVRFGPSWSWPKPTRRDAEAAHLPVLVGGGAGPEGVRRVAEYGDGWIPIGGAGLTTALPRPGEAVAAAGRDPATLEIVPFASSPTPASSTTTSRWG